MNPTGLALDAGGALYISCRNDGTIRKVVKPGQVETVIEGLGIATGIAFDRTGNLFVGDRAGTVHVVEPQGSTRQLAALPPSVAAYHLAVGPDDHLYVTAPSLSNDDPVYRIDASGTVTTVAEHLARPQGVAFDPAGALHVVAISGGDRGVFRIHPDGRPEHVVAGENLVGLAFDQQGRLLIASANSIYRLPWPLTT
jgi:sugar lactone lactonase YvrE